MASNSTTVFRSQKINLSLIYDEDCTQIEVVENVLIMNHEQSTLIIDRE